MSQPTKLLPCPMCGGTRGYTLHEGSTYRWWEVLCKDCGRMVDECYSDRRTSAGSVLPDRWPAADTAWKEAAAYAEGLRVAALTAAQPAPKHEALANRLRANADDYRQRRQYPTDEHAAKLFSEAADALTARQPAPKIGPFLFQFDSFEGWVNHAQGAWKRIGVRSDDTLCVDSAGRVCRIGRDFMAARDQGKFPVRVYLMRDDLPEYAAMRGEKQHEPR